MPGVRITVRGGTQTRAALATLPAAVRDEVAGVIREGADITLSEARRRVRRRSGELAGGIEQEIRDDGMRAKTGTKVPQGRFLEFGTRKMRAKPWLLPAHRKAAKHVRAKVKQIGAQLGMRIRARNRNRRRRS